MPCYGVGEGVGDGELGEFPPLLPVPPGLFPPFVPFELFVPFEFKLMLKPVAAPAPPTGVVRPFIGWPMAPALPPCND